MDKKDQKILTELILNSRMPINRLAKKVGVSREVATYRINKLIKNKIILGFYTVMDTETLGFTRFTCFFKLKGISHEKEEEFLKYLVNHDFVTYTGPVIGKWNLIFDILARDKMHLESLIKEISNYIDQYLESYIVIGTGIEQQMFPMKVFGINQEVHYRHSTKKIKINEIDLKILDSISDNTRIEYKEISKKLNLTGNAIKYRLKNLEKSGVIQGYTISVDERKLGYEWHNIQLKLTENKKEERLKQFLRNHPKVIYFYRYLGHENWDIDVGVIIKDVLELREFIFELRKNFGDILKIHDTYVVVEESKPNQVPKGVFRKPQQII